MNFTCNRIECNLELKYNTYSKNLNLDFLIPGVKPYIAYRVKKNQQNDKVFYSITFKFQTVESMIPIYDYFMKNRLYCDMKFYRISKIKEFIQIRSFKNYEKNSYEYKLYREFMLNWIKYQNPNWTKVPFVNKL
jgi:hypothetical protein